MERTEKFIEYMEKAEKTIQTVDHMVYVTFPLVKDKNLLLKILTETNLAVLNIVNAILQYEYLYKRIDLTKDARSNLRLFTEKCAPRYSITSEEVKLILELLDLSKKHRESPFEFIKEEKVVILSENMHQSTLSLEKVKEFIIMGKSILGKTKDVMKKRYL